MPRPLPTPRRVLPLLFLLLLGPFASRELAQPAVAQEESSKKPAAEIPLVVVNVASLERVLNDIHYTFASADRQDLSDALNGLFGFVRDFEGMDRTRPFGVMLFLQGGLTQPPAAVGYLPITDMDDLIETISLAPVTVSPVEGAENRYQIEGPGPTLHVALEHKYAFVTDNASALDRTLPDPAEAARTLSSRYDLSFYVNLDAISQSTKDLFLDFLRASTEAELQQRDDEPDGAYQVRRAQGIANLEFMEGLLGEGQDLTLGIDTSKETKSIVIEATITAQPESPFSKKLQDVAGRPSHFEPLFDESIPLSLSISWMMDKAGKKVVEQALETGEQDLTKRLAREGETEVLPVRSFFESLRATAKEGHIDIFAQYVGQPPEHFALIGGARVVNGTGLADGISGVLRRMQDEGMLEELELNAASHQNIAFHRFPMDSPGRDERRLYGEDAAIYVGAGPDALWFAVGGSSAMPALKQAMDRQLEAKTELRPKEAVAPFRLIANASSWVGLPDLDDDRPRARRELAREAFAQGGDKLRVDVRPTENGMRLRIQLDEGFIRLIGLGVGRQYDRSRL